jgi:hypothetical protein
MKKGAVNVGKDVEQWKVQEYGHCLTGTSYGEKAANEMMSTGKM